MNKLILNTLNKYDAISQINDISSTNVYLGKSYKYIYRFIYTIDNIGIPIVMGVPIDWDRKLIDVYIENYQDINYIPHIDNKGKICLFDLDGILIDKNFDGLLNQTLKRVYDTIFNGINELNKEDFILEFDQYWRMLPKTKVLKSMVKLNQEIRLIKYSKIQKEVKRKKGDKYIDLMRKKNNYSFLCTDFDKDFKLYKDTKNIKNGIYIYIETDTFIFPPDWRNELSIEYINTLISKSIKKSIEKEELISLFNKCSNDLIIMFNIRQPNGFTSLLGVNIKKYILDESTMEIIIGNKSELIPCWIVRCDEEFLVNRGGALSYITDKKILVIGCGSIGGYLINELIKTGIKNIDVVDGDILTEENIYRHLLGMEYIGSYKAKAIADYFNKNIPKLNIVSYSDYIEDVIHDTIISFSEYDLIISAVGNHNLNRWINEIIHVEKIKVPVIYSWNEALDIGSHVAFISISYKGCYECFFRDSEEGIYDRTSYCKRGQTFIKQLRGCSSGYLPFSSISSVTTTIAAIEVVKKYFEERINENFLVSIKGDGFYFKNAGFKTSSRYDKQSEIKQIIEGEKFMNDNCVICGDN